MNDIDIIKGCKAYEESAFKALVEKYSTLLMAVCMRYVADRALAEDLLQETYILIFKNIINFEDKGSLKAWMSKIAINSCLKYLRSKIHFSDINDINLELVDGAIDYEDMMENEVFQAIQLLSDKYRIVFNLYVVEGYNHKEISEMIDIKESTSRSLLSRAKDKLKEYLEIKPHYQIKINNSI